MRKLSVTDIEKSELVESIFFSKACNDNFTADKKQEFVNFFLMLFEKNNVQFNTKEYGYFSYENKIPYDVNHDEKCIEIDSKFVIDK
ncbi:TPA: hypothetical protein JI316_12840 [Acinetobacter baumannii]|nr:hypothetical protein [Acinetobacter baumannii]